MGILGQIWARMVGNETPAASPVASGSVARDAAPAPQVRPVRPAIGRLDGLALRSAEVLSGTFSDQQRLRWVLLQPEADAAARKFCALAGLGEKRAVEARAARESLRALLTADLPAESPEHIEMLLDLMQSGAQPAAEKHAPVPSSPRTTPDAARAASPVPQPPEANAVRPPIPQPQPDVEYRTAAPPVLENLSLTPLEYELHTLPGTGMADVDVALVREYVQGSTQRRTSSPLSDIGVPDVLRALKAIDGPEGGERLTVLGALYFATRPERLVVQSKVRFVEFPGTMIAPSGETVTYRYTEEITGTIPELIARMEQIHKERLTPGVLAEGFRVEEVPSVPVFALREAMVNAVCHRDYSLIGANIQVRLFEDRLEVQSPGGLPGPVTVDNILTESYARNPRVADILRDLGYVERHGLGIDNMVQSMRDAHLPAPEFRNSDTSFTVVLRFREADEAAPEAWMADIGAAALGPAQRKGLVFTRRMGRMVGTDYQSLNLLDAAESGRQLRTLVRDGWLVQSATGEAAFYALGPRAGSSPAAGHDAPVLPPDVVDSLSRAQRRILDIVVRQRRVRASDVLEISGLKDRRTVQRTLAALTERGLLLRRASSRTDPNASYEVNPDFKG